MFWLAVFTEFGLKAFKTGRTNGNAWCNRDKEITSPQAHLAYYMVHFEQMLVLSETQNVNILNQNLTLGVPSLQNFWALVVFKRVFLKFIIPLFTSDYSK